MPESGLQNESALPTNEMKAYACKFSLLLIVFDNRSSRRRERLQTQFDRVDVVVRATAE